MTINTSTTEVFANADRRRLIFLENTGSTKIWLKFDAPAVVNEGFSLDAGQKTIIQPFHDDNNVSLNAIAVTSPSTLIPYNI